MPSRRRSWSIHGRRNIETPNPHDKSFRFTDPDCLCDLASETDVEKRRPGDVNQCKKHYRCRPSCEPLCHGKSPKKRIKEEVKDDPAVSILDLLHPIPRDLPYTTYANREVARMEKRKHEQKTWQIYLDLLKQLAHNLYENCICDVVGLEDAFQIVQDPRSRIDYPHRPNCLKHPNIENWEADPRHPHLHAAQALEIYHFRKTGRSRSGRKQYRKNTIEQLVRSCGLQHRFEGLSGDDEDSSETDHRPASSPNRSAKFLQYDGPSRKTESRFGPPEFRTKKRRQPPLNDENERIRYDSRTIAADILRVAGIHPSRPPLNPHLNPQLLYETTSHGKVTKKQKRNRQRASMPNAERFKSAEFVVADSD